VLDQAFLFCVAVEPDDGAQPAGDGGACLAAILDVTGEAFDVGPADVEQAPIVLPASGRELTEIQCVGVTGEPPVAGSSPSNVVCSTSDNTDWYRTSAVVELDMREPLFVVAGDPDDNATRHPSADKVPTLRRHHHHRTRRWLPHGRRCT
jgi:hypothetical protein